MICGRGPLMLELQSVVSKAVQKKSWPLPVAAALMRIHADHAGAGGVMAAQYLRRWIEHYKSGL